MQRRNLAQLGIVILDCDVPLSQPTKERPQRHVGDAKALAELFVLFQQFGRNGPTSQHVIDDLLELRLRDSGRATAHKIDCDVGDHTLRALDDWTARRLCTYALRIGGRKSDHPGDQCARTEYPPHVSDSGFAAAPNDTERHSTNTLAAQPDLVDSNPANEKRYWRSEVIFCDD